ncbi:MAG: thiamine phosphate synthase [Bacteroidetes bacterium]|nr:thiamine phosphate synthase [Bacteroidota bacterium]
MKDIDLRIYLVTDSTLSLGRPLEWIVEEAVKGGATIVQLREKDCSTHDFLELAIKLREILHKYNVPLIINDRVDIALASDADGVHIGQSDMPYAVVRKILGSDKIIGLSVENMEQAHEAESLDVDYIAVSPVFSTNTKTDTSDAMGLEGVKKVASFSKHPIVGIGGMNKDTIKSVIEAGAKGVAIVSAIVSAESPQSATRQLLNLIK